jgi:N4-gp56 family major capsid protein
MFFPGAKGEDAFGTGPRRSAFIALGHTDLIRSLEQLDGYLPKWNYPSGADAQTLESEQGAVNNTRFFLSSVGSKKPNASAMGRTVYPAVIAGMEAFAKVKQDNFSSQYIYQPGYDPLRQYFTAGWTTAMATMICNDLWASLLNSTLPV